MTVVIIRRSRPLTLPGYAFRDIDLIAHAAAYERARGAPEC